MDNPRVFDKAASLLAAGENVALVTVIATTGSTPGKVGYKMLVYAGSSETVGTVGGGFVEAEIIKRAGNLLAGPTSSVFRFELGETPDDEKGICGGSVEMLVETFDETALPLFKALLTAGDSNEPAVLVSVISQDQPPKKSLLRDNDQIAATDQVSFDQKARKTIHQTAAETPRGKRVIIQDRDLFVEDTAQPPIVHIFGAGHLAYHIARYAKSVGFRISVFDERSEYANAERFPDVDEIVVGDFAGACERIGKDATSYVVIVTRGHKCDEIVLEQALKTDAAYIGMIGSKRKTLTIFDNLRAKGATEQALSRVYSPVGLSLGAITPEEIALSIVCEFVKIRRLGHDQNISHMTISRVGGTR